jgi:hypothetical protein
MPNWQITAKTIYCDAVDDEVTLLVYKDGSARCSGRKKYLEPNSLTLQMIKKKTRSLGRKLRCEAEQCSRIIRYKDQILAEEITAKS